MQEPTSKQIESLAMLLANILLDYGLPIDTTHVVGHRDLMATACPGYNLYKILQTIRGISSILSTTIIKENINNDY